MACYVFDCRGCRGCQEYSVNTGLRIKDFTNIMGKGEVAASQLFSPLLTMFSAFRLLNTSK